MFFRKKKKEEDLEIVWYYDFCKKNKKHIESIENKLFYLQQTFKIYADIKIHQCSYNGYKKWQKTIN